MNPEEEERWIEPRAQEAYDRFIRISQKHHNILPLESRDKSFTQEESENLWKQNASELIRGSVYADIDKKRIERERNREEEIAAAKEVENKRWATKIAAQCSQFCSRNSDLQRSESQKKI
uniref:Uncharacterized protein n=1 Tax=Solanum lycopersicum TaxID=4081 RepID=K4BZI0_SOLLC